MARIARYEDRHFDGVRTLWEAVFPDDPPWNRAEHAIPAKMAFQPDLFLVALVDEVLVGTVMGGYDGHRGWLYALAVAPAHRRKGVAAALVEAAEARLRGLGCGKVNLQVRASNTEVIGVYRRLGYDVEDRISLGKRF